MDWNVLLSAIGVIVTLGSLIISTYASLSKKIQSIGNRLSHYKAR